MMKPITFLLISMLAIAGSGYAQDTSATTAARGAFPSGTSFNGVPINALQIATGSLIGADGVADGGLSVDLVGQDVLGQQRIINLEVTITGGSHPADNVATISGTCTVNMGDGTPPLLDVPFVATIAANADHQGTVGLVIGATSLPAATINEGSMTIVNLEE